MGGYAFGPPLKRGRTEGEGRKRDRGEEKGREA